MNAAFAVLSPYLLWIKAGIAALILGGVFLFGRGCGVDSQKAETAKVEQRLDKAQGQLSIAAIALRQAATTLQGISDATEAEVIRSRENAKAGQDAASAAAKDAKASADKVASLEARLKVDRATCTQEEARICGTPLR